VGRPPNAMTKSMWWKSRNPNGGIPRQNYGGTLGTVEKRGGEGQAKTSRVAGFVSQMGLERGEVGQPEPKKRYYLQRTARDENNVRTKAECRE